MSEEPDEHFHLEVTPSEIQGEIELLDSPVLGFFKVEYIGHALDHMRKRAISRHDVLTTIRSPDEEGLPTQPNRTRVRRNQNRREAIDVVYDILEDRVRVITAFKTRLPFIRRRRR